MSLKTRIMPRWHYVDIASRQGRLNRSQTRALARLRAASEEEFQRVTAYVQSSPNAEIGHVSRDFWQRDLRDLSAREIEEIADKAAKKESLKDLNREKGDLRAEHVETKERAESNVPEAHKCAEGTQAPWGLLSRLR